MNVSTAVLILPATNDSNFLIPLSKIAKYHAWNKLKSYKKTPISTHTSSAIKSNAPLLTGDQCKKQDYQLFYLAKISTQTMSTKWYLNLVLYSPTAACLNRIYTILCGGRKLIDIIGGRYSWSSIFIGDRYYFVKTI